MKINKFKIVQFIELILFSIIRLKYCVNSFPDPLKLGQHIMWVKRAALKTAVLRIRIEKMHMQPLIQEKILMQMRIWIHAFTELWGAS